MNLIILAIVLFQLAETSAVSSTVVGDFWVNPQDLRVWPNLDFGTCPVLVAGYRNYE
jgi:hypothetical protein